MRFVTYAQAAFASAPIRFALATSLSQRLIWAMLVWPGTFFQVHLERFWHTSPQKLGYFHTPWQLIDIWARWDAIFYLQIAERGYACPTDYLCAAFFPLFSCLVRGVHDALGTSYLASGLWVANSLDTLGTALVALWFTRRLGPQLGFWAFTAFAAYPTRNFGFSVYTEGLFLTLSVGSFLAYERRRWALTALLCALASATRPQGVLVGFALWLDAVVRVAQKAPDKPPARSIALLCASPLGLVCYMAYLQRTFGDPLLFAHVQHVWHRHVQAPWRIIGVHAEPIEYVVLATAIGLCIYGVRTRAALRDSVYVALSLLVPMCTGRFTSINRFTGVLFPLFALAVLMPRRRGFAMAYWALCAVYTLVFAFKLGQGAKVI